MSASESKKTKKRKMKKGAMSSTNQGTSPFVEHLTVATSSNCSTDSSTYDRLTAMIEEVSEEQMNNSSMLLGPNPYLGGERCLLCRCERPPSAKCDFDDEFEGEDDKGGTLSQLALWVCAECRKTVEEEEKRAAAVAADISHLQDGGLLGLQSVGGEEDLASMCQCESCQERRVIEAEHELETQELQQCWIELRTIIQDIYREGCSQKSPETEDGQDTASALSCPPEHEKAKDLVARLVSRDPHQLFQRLESQGREVVMEMKDRLHKQLSCGYKAPAQAKTFIAMLLQEYNSLCAAAKTMVPILHQLEQEHMKQFNLTWELHNKHLFHHVIYHNQEVQKLLPTLITNLRHGSGTKEANIPDTFPRVLQQYLQFDDEMNVVAVIWRDCAQLLESYSEEQATLKAKQKMLKEDWEFFKAQRKLLEEQVLKSKAGTISPHAFEQQFTETMRQILQGSKNNSDECQCPNCNRKRCSCDECTITHMITCGLISPEVTESEASHHQNVDFSGQGLSRYSINVTPPSISSTNTSSGSSSPIIVDPERLTLPFDDCPESFDMPDEIRQEMGELVSSSEDEGNGDDDDGDCEYDDEDDNDDDEDYCDDDDDDDEDDEDCDDDDEKLVQEAEDSGILGGQHLSDVQDAVQSAVDTCDCTHCSQAKIEQTRQLESQKQAEEEQVVAGNQCQCHACLQQSGHIMTSLPQHIPTAPRPAALHLYPHIHGSNVHDLNTITSTASGGLHGHMIQPHLFKLHNTSPGKSGQQHSDFNLDLNPEALQEHMYHAYGEWDNSYDVSKLVMGTAHKFATFSNDMLPPPPLISSSQFMSEDSHTHGLSTKVVTSTSSSVITEHIHTEACFKTVKSVSRTMLNANQSKAKVNMNPTTTHNDHCFKHNPFLHTHHTSYASSQQTNPTVTSSGGAHSRKPYFPELKQLRKETNGCQRPNDTAPRKYFPDIRNAKDGLASIQNGCTHGNHTHNNQPLLSVNNNVSVGTSTTTCNEPDCDVNHDDNDSIDDSCSEQSSSTSTSNQKDGKYCDCCYCEFFGHSNPPTAPISRNYAEIRERLRLRLKKKKEKLPSGGCANSPMSKEDELNQERDERALEELIKFINGENSDQANHKLSAKAAKRARQKQRKAEEKARQEAAERERLLQEQREREEAAARLAQAQRKKKKGKHKASDKSTTLEKNSQHLDKENIERSSREQGNTGGKLSIPSSDKQQKPAAKKKEREQVRDAKTLPKPQAKTPNGPSKTVAPPEVNSKNVQNVQNGQVVRKQPNCHAVEEKKCANERVANTQSQRVEKEVARVPKPDAKASPEAKMDAVMMREQLAAMRLKIQHDKVMMKHKLEQQQIQTQPQPQQQQQQQQQLNNKKKGKKGQENNIGNNQTCMQVPNHVKPPAFPQETQTPTKQEPKPETKQDKQTKTPKTPMEAKQKEETSPRENNGKNKKNKRRGKQVDDLDEIFMPRDLDLDIGEIDEGEREVEEFKRFCMFSKPAGERVQVNMNMKDLLSKKKISCV